MADEEAKAVLRFYTDTVPKSLQQFIKLLQVASVILHGVGSGVVAGTKLTNLDLMNATYGGVVGQHDLRKLSRSGREISSQEFNAEDVKRLRSELKRYGVEFAVVPKKNDDGLYTVFFAAKDTQTLAHAVDNVLKSTIDNLQKDKDKNKQSDLGERIKQAWQRAESKNSQRETVDHQRSKQKTVEI